jgi:hypothetical protein
MNQYRLKFTIHKDYDADGMIDVGEYWATVEAETPQLAEEKALAELQAANVGTRHVYRVVSTVDMGPPTQFDPE